MTICYFGTYNPDESRNRIYIKGLKEHNVHIVECRDNSWGPFKFWKLFWKHWKIRKSYDVLVVGYPGHVVTPFARLISRKPIIFDALCTMYEGVIISRRRFKEWSFRTMYIKFVDLLSVFCAHVVLVESENQKRYFEEKFNTDKCRVIYTGADNAIFHPDPNVKKREKFTAIFRGKFLPEAGVTHIVKAAKLLEDSDVDIVLMGSGWLEKEIRREVETLHISNVEFISGWSPSDEIRERMLECHVSLGQFEDHERLSRTIPHKAFESLALGVPYITARTSGIAELLKGGENCLMVEKASPQAIYEAIMRLKGDMGAVQRLSHAGLELYHKKLTPYVLSGQILDIIKQFSQ